MSRMHKVYLVPGFFGFSQLGSLSYFHRVAETLGAALDERGLEAEVVELGTAPTASIRRRAINLLTDVESTGGLEADSVSFVGHSTGGLDVRLLLSPCVRLVPGDNEELVGQRTTAALSLATPHFGTPIANFFTSMNGRQLLYLLTTLVTSEPGRVGAWMGARALGRLARFDDRWGQTNTVLDSLAEGLFAHIRPQRGDELFTYLTEVASDQGAMLQLAPEAVDLFNAAVLDRHGVDYASFITAAPSPRYPKLPGLTPTSYYESLTFLIFSVIHTLASRESRHYPYPSLAHTLGEEVQAQLPFPLTSATNDGVVPTLSQIWGRLGGVYVGDHLDVTGQYSHALGGQRIEGWLHSRAHFDDERFQQLWGDIADTVVAAALAGPGAAEPIAPTDPDVTIDLRDRALDDALDR